MTNSYNGKEILDVDVAIKLRADFGGLYTAQEANIPIKYRPMSLDSLYPEMQEYKDKVKHYFWDRKKSLILFSKAPGAGKTLMAISACLAGKHHSLQQNVYLAKFVDYIKIPDITSWRDEHVNFWKEAEQRKTWIIDDVQPYDSKHEVERKTNFKLFIKFLYNSDSKFIVTTTMNKEERLDYFGSDTVSRMDEMAVVLQSDKSNVRDAEEKASNKVDHYQKK